LYDTKGRFVLHKIDSSEKEYKLCKVKSTSVTLKKVPYLVTHDGRTIRYPDPLVKTDDVVKVDIKTGKIIDFIKFDSGKCCTVTKGNNTGRVGTIIHFEKHPGSFDIATIRDAAGNTFATRTDNVFVLGNSSEDIQVSLPKGNGVRLNIIEESAMIQSHRKNKA
jgi:small subunit ribosomal protein S4e